MTNPMKIILAGATPLLLVAGSMQMRADATDQVRANAPSQATQPAFAARTQPATQPAAPPYQSTDGIRR